jgi:hypothetical protein
MVWLNMSIKVMCILNTELSGFFSSCIALFVSSYLMSHLNKTLNIGNLLIMLSYVIVAFLIQIK